MNTSARSRIIGIVLLVVVTVAICFGFETNEQCLARINKAIDGFETNEQGTLEGSIQVISDKEDFFTVDSNPKAVSLYFEKSSDGYDYMLQNLEDPIPSVVYRTKGNMFYITDQGVQQGGQQPYADPTLLKQMRARAVDSFVEYIQKIGTSAGLEYRVYMNDEYKLELKNQLKSAGYEVDIYTVYASYIIDSDGNLVGAKDYSNQKFFFDGQEAVAQTIVSVDSVSFEGE